MENNKKCERCKNKLADYICYNCEPIKNFCSNCDTVVHSLPSKRIHKRDNLVENIQIKSNTLKIEENKGKNIFNNIQEFSPINYICSSPKIDRDTNYTREYVREIKNIHEKEKEELIFKYNSLLNNLNRLKISFSDQIYQLQKQIEENNQKNSFTLRKNEDENNMRLCNTINDKDNKINFLKKQIEEFKQCNEELLIKLNDNYKLLKEEKQISNNLNNEIDNIIFTKNNEINDLKNNYENKLVELKSTLINDMEKLSYRNDLDLKNMKDLINRKDIELNNSLEKKKIDEDVYLKTINELREKNEEITQNIQRIMNENRCLSEDVISLRENLKTIKNENEINKRYLDRNNNELNSKNEEISYLENYISSLKTEIETLSAKNNLIQKDYDILYEKYEKTKSNSNRISDEIDFREYKIRELQTENNELKKDRYYLK